MKLLLLVMIIATCVIFPVLAADLVDTTDYFPVHLHHTYTVFNGSNIYQYEFLGKRLIEKKEVYLISKNQIGSSVRKDVYSIENNGDIYYLGFVTAENGKVNWEKTPMLQLKRKMEIGKPYIVDKLPQGRGKVILTFKGFQNVKLKKVYKNCLVLERYTAFDKKIAPGSMDLKDTYFYAKNIGVIKYESGVYRIKNGKLVPDGPPMSEWIHTK